MRETRVQGDTGSNENDSSGVRQKKNGAPSPTLAQIEKKLSNRKTDATIREIEAEVAPQKLMQRKRAVVKNTSARKDGIFSALSLLFLKNTKFTALFMAAIVLFGAVSYTTLLRREGFPTISVPITVAAGTYFVDDAARVDADVTKPVSEVIRDVPGVEMVQTFADNNVFQLVANLEADLTGAEGEQRIQEALDAQDVLPEGAQLEFLEINASKILSKYDMLISVVATNGATAQEIEQQAQKVVNTLGSTSNVAESEVEVLFETGINPLTGEAIVQQTSFNRFGEKDEGGNFNFYPAVIVGVVGAGGDSLDIFELSDSVKSALESLELDEGFEAAVSADFTDQVSTQINSLQSNVISGLVAVTIISLIMISWRVSILSVVFMVSVIFVTSGILYLAGYTLNTITLFALVLALGLFVDDATIISEAIDASKSKKLGKKQIIKKAISNIGAASAAGTMTTALVFVPLLFVSGIIGSFIFLLPVTVIIALLVSLTLSLTLIPFLAQFTILTDKNREKHPWHNPVPDWIASTILRLRTHKKQGILIGFFMISLSFASLAGSGYFASQLTFNIFPPSKDSDLISAQISFADGTAINEAEAIVDEINEVLVSVIGENLVRAGYSRDTSPSNRSAVAILELTPFSSRDIKSPEIIANLEEAFVNFNKADVIIVQLDAGPPADQFPFKTQVNAENFEKGVAAALDIQQFLQGRTIERLNGTTASIVETRVANREGIVRQNGIRVVEVQAAYDANDVTALLQQTQSAIESEYSNERLAEYQLNTADLSFDFGQETENEESFTSLGLVSLIAVIVMFVLLAIQFKSLLEPLLIFLALPFSFLGVTFGLFITDNPLSFFAMIGFVGLVGIAVNNTILLTDSANRALRAGAGPIEAIAQATRKRFRPLFTTTATTVAALAPLALADPFWEPLAVTIMFGLISSTILVVVAFPYYYIIAATLTEKLKRHVLRR